MVREFNYFESKVKVLVCIHRVLLTLQWFARV
jgi:hypothetical protein